MVFRYNISTDDYNPFTTTSEQNGDDSWVQPLIDISPCKLYSWHFMFELKYISITFKLLLIMITKYMFQETVVFLRLFYGCQSSGREPAGVRRKWQGHSSTTGYQHCTVRQDIPGQISHVWVKTTYTGHGSENVSDDHNMFIQTQSFMTPQFNELCHGGHMCRSRIGLQYSNRRCERVTTVQ